MFSSYTQSDNITTMGKKLTHRNMIPFKLKGLETAYTTKTRRKNHLPWENVIFCFIRKGFTISEQKTLTSTYHSSSPLIFLGNESINIINYSK